MKRDQGNKTREIQFLKVSSPFLLIVESLPSYPSAFLNFSPQQIIFFDRLFKESNSAILTHIAQISISGICESREPSVLPFWWILNRNTFSTIVRSCPTSIFPVPASYIGNILRNFPRDPANSLKSILSDESGQFWNRHWRLSQATIRHENYKKKNIE